MKKKTNTYILVLAKRREIILSAFFYRNKMENSQKKNIKVGVTCVCVYVFCYIRALTRYTHIYILCVNDISFYMIK